MTMTTLGERIRLARNRQKFNQQELAGLVDCTLQTIHRWETGKTDPTIDDVKKLAIALQTTSRHLAFGDEEESESEAAAATGAAVNALMASPDADLIQPEHEREMREMRFGARSPTEAMMRAIWLEIRRR